LDASRRIRERHDQRRDGTVADEAPDRESVHATIEHGLDQFDGFRCTALPAGFEIAADFGADSVHGGFLIVDRRTERQVRDDFTHGRRQRPADAIDADRHGSGCAPDVGRAELHFRIDADGAE